MARKKEPESLLRVGMALCVAVVALGAWKLGAFDYFSRILVTRSIESSRQETDRQLVRAKAKGRRE